MLSSDLNKTREICFSPLPQGQREQCLQLLAGLEHLQAQPVARPCCVLLEYNLLHYTLKGLETALIAQGFRLESSLLLRIRRALIYYCEEVQMENLGEPGPTRKTCEIFIQAYGLHPHGDRDETPPEWREYR